MDESIAPDSYDPTALAQRLFVQHSLHLRGFIVALMPDPGLVDDVFQETFLTVVKKAGDFDPARDFLAWACGIARMKIKEAGRRAARGWRPLSDEVLDALAASEPEPWADDPQLAVLSDCVNHLAPQARRIVELRYQQSHKPAEIARLIQWTVEAVYVALSRARAALKQCVGRKTAGGGA